MFRAVKIPSNLREIDMGSLVILCEDVSELTELLGKGIEIVAVD